MSLCRIIGRVLICASVGMLPEMAKTAERESVHFLYWTGHQCQFDLPMLEGFDRVTSAHCCFAPAPTRVDYRCLLREGRRGSAEPAVRSADGTPNSSSGPNIAVWAVRTTAPRRRSDQSGWISWVIDNWRNFLEMAVEFGVPTAAMVYVAKRLYHKMCSRPELQLPVYVSNSTASPPAPSTAETAVKLFTDVVNAALAEQAKTNRDANPVTVPTTAHSAPTVPGGGVVPIQQQQQVTPAPSSQTATDQERAARVPLLQLAAPLRDPYLLRNRPT